MGSLGERAEKMQRGRHAGLRSTAEDRVCLSGANQRVGERTVAAAERIIDDLDTLLAENAKLRAVAEAAKEYHETCNPGVDPTAERARAALGDALAALEAP